MSKKKIERRGVKGTLTYGNQSEEQIREAGQWENAAFRGDRDGALRVPRKKKRQ